ncbi:hypothetical protein PMPD1_2503 [Paramixta manurensis]|uniref:Uncharacterized protein n=1 Tax=Paramixta manurensis TaxID=2740817 RepID=A0A6M8U9S7_9GAMM|nr:hypothetical protein PMPD1_2503 [Erwiniaceae bacterium PD-1]
MTSKPTKGMYLHRLTGDDVLNPPRHYAGWTVLFACLFGATFFLTLASGF